MRAFCAGFNLYGQFSSINEKCVENFTCINFTGVTDLELSHSFLILKKVETNWKIYLNGFLGNKTHQNEELNISGDAQIAVSDSRALFLTPDQQLLCLQYNSNGSYDLKKIPKLDANANKILKISSGISMSNAYTSCGYIYNIPSKLDCDPLNVVDMCTGREHCLILTDHGSVLSFGGGSRGQLGHGDVENKIVPELIKCLEGIKILKIACGAWHSVAMSAEGDVYTWGWNSNGQLGLSNNSEFQEHITTIASPQVVDLDENIIDICCGSRHTIILTESSKLYGCGSNKYCQLGSRSNSENYYKFIFLHNFNDFDIIGLRCGAWNTAVLVKD